MKITSHKELHVWQEAMNAAMDVYQLTKEFPKEEKYSLVDQIRRSSRSVPANIAEAWRKRRYHAAFVAKLNDAEGEAAETQTWVEICCRCQLSQQNNSRRARRPLREDNVPNREDDHIAGILGY